MKVIYMIKFVLYAGISCYDHANTPNSSWVLMWAFLSMLMLAFSVIAHMEDYIDKKFDKK